MTASYSGIPLSVLLLLQLLSHYCSAGLRYAGRAEDTDMVGLQPLRSAICDRVDCQMVHLGKGIHDVRLDVAELCDLRGKYAPVYICNATLSPACAEVCAVSGKLISRQQLQKYVDIVLGSNPFTGPAGQQRDAWVVPHTDLSQDNAYIFMTQRQSLYLYMRTLALKIRFPNQTVVSNETNVIPPGGNSTVINALEYGLTYGCNWDAAHEALDPACETHGMWSGVGSSGIQGNIFALLVWLRQVAVESGAGTVEGESCYLMQVKDRARWCPHDAVIGAVRGGKSGPDAKDLLDTPFFWHKHDRPLSEIGVRPNVCHFERSEWVWNNSYDAEAEDSKNSYCQGAAHVPDAYGPGIRDFMSADRVGSLAVDIAGAQYGGGVGSASGSVFSTQDESTPLFYPETVALGFNSRNRSISTGKTSLIFLGVRRYFSGQSGSHGYDFAGLRCPLFNHGNSCGSLQYAQPLPPSHLLDTAVLTQLGSYSEGTYRNDTSVLMYKHSLGVITSSCGTCEKGNPPTTNMKYRTSGATCLVQWQHGKSACAEDEVDDWTYWKDVWIWVGALLPQFYPEAAQRAFGDLVDRVGTGPWGAGVWWGNTLQYFVVVWVATGLLWQGTSGPQLDYYAYGTPGQVGAPIGGFCEQYQAQGYEDVVRRLPEIDAILSQRSMMKGQPLTLLDLYNTLRSCSRCESNCTFAGVGPEPENVYCSTPCTDDFLQCFTRGLRLGRRRQERSELNFVQENDIDVALI